MLGRLLGLHVGRARPLRDAERVGAEVISLHLSAPQAWAPPIARGDEAALAASGLACFVHAPYLCNPASPDPVVRARTREALQAQDAAAARIGALGVVVHAGQAVTGDVDTAVAGWTEVVRGWEPAVPLLIENTAGGRAAPGRRLDDLARLWDGLHAAGFEPGFCLDTCHAHAAGEGLDGIVERVLTVTGRIDLLHLNDSRDDAGSGRDRHERLGQGTIDPELLVAVVRQVRAPVVLETPGTPDEHAAELAWLREQLAMG